MKILYVTFFEPVLNSGLYETQVRQLVRRLKAEYGRELMVSHCAMLPAGEIGRRGLAMPLLTHRQDFARLKKEYRQDGIEASFCFLPVVLPKRWGSELPLPVLAFLLFLAVPAFVYRIARERPQIIHCRSYMATLIAQLSKLIFHNCKLVFDPRGFWPEEGVVTKRWKEHSLRFRFWKRVERYLFRRSDRVIALSESFAARVSQTEKLAKCQVIYASADVERFRNARASRSVKRKNLALEDKTVFVYNGSLHAWHDPGLLAQIYSTIKRHSGSTKLLVVTGHDQNQLHETFAAAGLQPEDYLIMAAKPAEVPECLATGDFGLVPLTEIQERSPMSVVAETMIGTKVAEYLSSGLPLIVNKQVGGLRWLMDKYEIGIFFDSKKLDTLAPGISHIQENYVAFQRNCWVVANRYLASSQSARAYYELYQELLSGSHSTKVELETAGI